MTDQTPAVRTHAELAVRFVPQGLDERIRLAKLLAESDMLPRALQDKPANVLLVMDYADALGLRYSQAIASINIMDGKPSASAALIQRQVRNAGHRVRVSGDDRQATATIVRSDDPDFEYKSVWTIERAAQAGLCTIVDGKPRARSQNGKPLPWETYTANVLKARALTEVSRDACQDALMGVQYTAEELGAIVDENGDPIFDGNRSPQRVESVVVDSTPSAKGHNKSRVKADPKARPVVVETDPIQAAAEKAARDRVEATPAEPLTQWEQKRAEKATAEDAPQEPETPPDVSADAPVAPEPVSEEPAPMMVDQDETDHWEDEWVLRLESFIDNNNREGIAGLAQEALNASRSDLVAVARAAWKSSGSTNDQ